MRRSSGGPSIPVMVALVAICVSVAPARVAAQALTTSPAPSPAWPRWGAEAAFGPREGVGLLHFRNPAQAWMLAVDASFAQQEGLPGDESEKVWNVNTRLGLRHYRGDSLGVRPILGAGLLAQLARFSASSRLWKAGVYAELGGAYFFTRRLSLGAMGDLRAAYGETRYDLGSTEGIVKVWSVDASLLRVTAAVYF